MLRRRDVCGQCFNPSDSRIRERVPFSVPRRTCSRRVDVPMKPLGHRNAVTAAAAEVFESCGCPLRNYYWSLPGGGFNIEPVVD